MFDWIIAYYILFFGWGVIINYRSGVRTEVVLLTASLELPILGRMLNIW